VVLSQSVSVGAVELTQMCEFSHQVCNTKKSDDATSGNEKKGVACGDVTSAT